MSTAYDHSRLAALAMAFSDANGVSGFEDAVHTVARPVLEPCGAVTEDKMRNLYCRRAENTGARPVVQLDAHMDEVGFMVHSICPNGTLRFITMGGWVANNISAHTVRVQTADGSYVTGVVATKPPHFMSAAERNQPASVENMVIDIGARSAEEAKTVFGIRIGAPVVPDVTARYDAAHDLLIGKAFDCRLGCAAIAEALTRLRGKQLAVDVVAALSTQEEMGTRGATVTAQTVRPDLAIVLEGCPCDDTFLPPDRSQTRLKEGPYLRHIDQRMISHPRFQRFALDLAEKLGIPVQEGVRTGGSTNGAPIHLSGQGVPTIVIGVPVRYIHTHYGVASCADVEHSVQLLTALLETLTPDVIDGF